MKSERTFATFRVAGDSLVPDQLTKLLGIHPTLAYGKGEHYTRGPRSRDLKGRTGVWLLSTDAEVQSNRLTDHIEWLLSRITPNQAKLRRFIEQNSLHAVMTCFWHGPPGARPPVVPKQALDVLEAIPAKLEEDFDADDQPPVVPVSAQVR
jgi:Domain of unknown function (DUF4279)